MDEEKGLLEGSIARDAPSNAGTDEEKTELIERCRTDRGGMTPHETADCAGERQSEEFESEEDGGT